MVTAEKITANGFTTEYIKFGKGERTLVILPGLSIQSVIPAAEAIENQYAVFENDFTVYLFERRKELPKAYSVKMMADDIAQAIRALKLENICLFGVSQGGMIALTLAADYPELVEKTAVCSTCAYIDESSYSVIAEWISLAEEGRAKELYLSFAKSVYPENVFEQYKQYFIDTAKSVTDSELKRFVTLAKAIEGFDIRKKADGIKCPLFVTGDRQDKVLGTAATDKIADIFKNKSNFEMFVYDGYGHAAYDTAPDYTERLYKFFI